MLILLCMFLFDSRLSLPVQSMKEEVLKSLQDNKVILIAGDTGCGKTTQVLYNVMLKQYS